MTEHEFTLADRIAKIKSINELYNLENNAYISFSGGKDSTVLHYLIDEALPGNKIPRVFINTGIEYKLLVMYVKDFAEKDSRVKIIAPKTNIKTVTQKFGFPFKSKVFAHNLHIYQNNGLTQNVKNYIKRRDFGCPKALLYTFQEGVPFPVSEKCCDKIKKAPSESWSKDNGKTINITGIRAAEGGGRKIHKECTVFLDKNYKQLSKFHPLLVVNDDFIQFYINKNRIKLCDLYYPPYNFTRTGCKGCPFALDLQAQLDTLEKLLPEERKQCEYLWKPVYDEYRRIGYRLRKESDQPSLFD